MGNVAVNKAEFLLSGSWHSSGTFQVILCYEENKQDGVVKGLDPEWEKFFRVYRTCSDMFSYFICTISLLGTCRKSY